MKWGVFNRALRVIYGRLQKVLNVAAGKNTRIKGQTNTSQFAS